MPTRNASKYRGVTIRRRTNSWQVDFGTTNGKRVQRSYPTKQDAKEAIDDHLEHFIKSLSPFDNRISIQEKIEVNSKLRNARPLLSRTRHGFRRGRVTEIYGDF